MAPGATVRYNTAQLWRCELAATPPEVTPVRIKVLGRQIDQTWVFFLVLYAVMAFIFYTVFAFAGPTLEPASLAAFAVLMLIHAALHHSLRRFEATPLARPGGVASAQWSAWFYVLLQYALPLLMVLLVREWLVAALLFPVAAEGFALMRDVRAGLAVVAVGLAVWAVAMYAVGGTETAVTGLPLGIAVFAFVTIYVGMFTRQERERGRVEGLLRALEGAHGELAAAHRQLQEYAVQVEMLTISNERQRMARELHDTLAQGLAGLIMQLEAIDGLLGKGHPAKARAVTQQALERARVTLADARRSIQALRAGPLERGSLAEAVRREVESFTATCGVHCSLAWADDSEVGALPQATAQHLLRIVQEGLANVARHAQARHVSIQFARSGERVDLRIRDDGIGFTPAEAIGRPGHFGLVGLQERVRLAGGRFTIASAPGQGASLEVTLPLGDEQAEGAL